MSTAIIVNAAPMAIPLGIRDLSTRQVPRDPEAIPTHLPKVYLYTKKGPTTPTLVSGAERSQIYGADSFDLTKKWANHATLLSNTFTKQANAQMIERIVPTDAGPAANFLLSLDVLPCDIDNYDRNTDGSIKLDALGDPIVLGQIPGHKVKWVVSNISTTAGMTNFGQATVVPGDQTDAATSTQSQRYPVLEFRVSSIGADGNNAGIRIWAPTTKTSGIVDKRILERGRAYPFRMSVIRRADALTSPKVVENLFGEQYVDMALKPGFINPITEGAMYIGSAETFLEKYQNLKDVNYPPLFGDFDTVAVYKNNIDTLINLFYTREHTYHVANGLIGSWSDFTSVTDEQYLFNLVGGTTSDGYKYHTYQFVSAANSVTLSEYSNMYASGGSDGTMTNAAFAAAVSAKVLEYNNPNSHLLDDAINVESVIYDSGFPLQTKKDLLSFIAIRKDTCVVLSTYEDGGLSMTASQENSLAVSLRTYAQMYPESEYFGTGVCRALIMGRDGKLRSSNWDNRVPVTMEVASKAAAYMGASNGIWKNGFHFDGAPGSILTEIYDVNVTYTPPAARNRDWDAGLNWVQSYDRSSLFIPALKTVYGNDTSVLTGWLTVMAIVEINKVCMRAWRHFSGVQNLTNAQLADRVNRFIADRLRGRFDGRFVMEPQTVFTTADLARGYSWTTYVKIYAPNMKTVMTTYVEAYRREDLETA